MWLGFSGFLSRTISRLRGRPATSDGRPQAQKVHRNRPASLEANLELGQRVYDALVRETSADFVAQYARYILSDDPDIVAMRLPHGFWRRFVEGQLHLQFNVAQRLRLYRALRIYMSRRSDCPVTLTAMRAGRRRHSARSDGGRYNAAKARGIGWALLQFFIDEVQELRSRSDSTILLNKAR